MLLSSHLANTESRASRPIPPNKALTSPPHTPSQLVRVAPSLVRTQLFFEEDEPGSECPAHSDAAIQVFPTYTACLTLDAYYGVGLVSVLLHPVWG
jgi:hypothetical protein